MLLKQRCSDPSLISSSDNRCSNQTLVTKVGTINKLGQFMSTLPSNTNQNKPKFHLITEKHSENTRLKILPKKYFSFFYPHIEKFKNKCTAFRVSY